MESSLFSRFGENFRAVWRFWELWRSKMQFRQNVLRMTWKERFVQFSWKTLCFSVLKRITGHCEDFENFDAKKCDLAKTCCAWPAMSVLYNVYGKRPFFPLRREFQASVTILRILTLKNAIWPKRAAHDLKRAFCTFFMETALFFRFEEHFISGQFYDFEKFDAHKCDLAKTCCAWPAMSVLYNVYGKLTLFLFWREFQSSVTISRTLALKNAIWPKRAAHDLKRAFCTIFMESALFFSFLREMEAIVTILRTLTLKNAIWPTRAAHDLQWAFCTIFMESPLFSRFGENFSPVWRFWELWRSKMRFRQNVLRMTWKERFVQFSWKAHCFPVLKRIWDKCNDFKNFDAQKMRFGQNVLRMTWKELFVQFPWKAHCFSFLKRIWGQFQDFKKLTLRNATWPKRAAHDLKRAFRTIFMTSALFSLFGENFRPVWRFWELWGSKMRFGKNVLRMTWKERFVQFSWKAHFFPVLARILGQCDDFENFDAQKCDLAKTCCAWPEKSVLYNFYGKRTVFPFWREFEASFAILRTLTLKCDLAKTCSAWFEKSVLCNFHGKRTAFPFWPEFEASVTILRTLTL